MYTPDNREVKGLIFDIDGVLTYQKKTYPGAVEVINRLRSEGITMRFLTNSTLKSQHSCAAKLRDAGFIISDNEALTASFLTAEYLRTVNPRSIWLMLEREGVEEFADFKRDEDNPEYVVIGDNRSKFDFENLNKALRLLKNGANLIGMTGEILDSSMGEMELNVGAWVRLMELASGVQPIFIGKPCKFAYDLTLRTMSLKKEEILAIGDRINTDILGANDYGIGSILVKSGEYVEGDLNIGIKPDYVIEHIDQLLEILH